VIVHLYVDSSVFSDDSDDDDDDDDDDDMLMTGGKPEWLEHQTQR